MDSTKHMTSEEATVELKIGDRVRAVMDSPMGRYREGDVLTVAVTDVGGTMFGVSGCPVWLAACNFVPADQPQPVDFQVGDLVRVKSTGLVGRVTALGGEAANVLCADGSLDGFLQTSLEHVGPKGAPFAKGDLVRVTANDPRHQRADLIGRTARIRDGKVDGSGRIVIDFGEPVDGCKLWWWMASKLKRAEPDFWGGLSDLVGMTVSVKVAAPTTAPFSDPYVEAAAWREELATLKAEPAPARDEPEPPAGFDRVSAPALDGRRYVREVRPGLWIVLDDRQAGLRPWCLRVGKAYFGYYESAAAAVEAAYEFVGEGRP